MWKKIFILVMVLITSLCVWSADGDKFQTETPGGVMMKFKVISEAEKTCAVASDAIDYTTKGVVTVPEEVKGYKVVEIQPNSFVGSYYITSVSLPNTLTSIGSYAFNGCTSLTAITLPGSLTAIGSYAFYYCTSLTDMTLPASLTTIGGSAFSGCSKLHWKELPTNLVSIGADAFSGCTIDSVSVREGMELSGRPFANCTINIISVHTKVFQDWFQNNTSIKKVYIGKEVETIGSSFRYNHSLKGCSGIEIIKVDTANVKYDSREDCNAIIITATNMLDRGCNTSTIPKTVTSINRSAFEGCTGLTSIELPASLTSIDVYAFNGCTGLTSIELPASLKSIESSAFSNCTNIQNVVSHIRKPFRISAFPAEVLSTATLTVPYGRTLLYKSVSGWNFQTIKEMEGTYEESTFIQFADSLTKVFCVKNWDENKDGELSLYEASLVTSLKNISIANDIVSFDELKYFENLSDIGTAFRYRTNLSSITLPNSVTAIGTQAFYNCI